MPPIWTILPMFLAALVIACAVRRDRIAVLSAALMLCDWAAGWSARRGLEWLDTGGLLTFSEADLWAWRGVTDTSAAVLFILFQRRRETLLGALYAIEALAHIAYGVTYLLEGYSYPSDLAYYWSTFWIAWTQAIFFAGWTINDNFSGGRKVRSYDGHRRHRVQSAANRIRGAFRTIER